MHLRWKHVLLGLGVLFLLLIIVAISVPNLLRSREVAYQRATGLDPPLPNAQPYAVSYGTTKLSSARVEGRVGGVIGGVPGGVPIGQVGAAVPGAEVDVSKKVLRTAKLDLVVHDSRQAVDELRNITAQLHGEIDHVAISGDGASLTAEMQVRVPAEQLDSALARYKKVAIKVTTENVDAQDVTRQWVDEEARLKNLRETEQQYRDILRSAHSVKDVLEVTEKLNEVRGEIESADAEHRALAHNVAMSSVAITLRQEGAGELQGVEWHPWLNAKAAWRNLKADLAGWADSMVSFLLALPVILLWLVTVVLVLIVIIKVIGFIFRRFFPNFRWPWQKAKAEAQGS